VEHEVEKEIQQWESKTGNIFTIFGISYSEYTKTAREEHKQKKELEKTRKVNVIYPLVALYLPLNSPDIV